MDSKINEWITINRLAAHFRVHRSTVISWRVAGCRFVMKNGKWYSTIKLCAEHRAAHPPCTRRVNRKRKDTDDERFNMSMKEIATELNMPITTIQSVYKTAIKKLKNEIVRNSYFYISAE